MYILFYRERGIYIYIYIYVHIQLDVCIYIYIYIYTPIHRERYIDILHMYMYIVAFFRMSGTILAPSSS